MNKLPDTSFAGFTPQTLDFLISLQFNNNKAWFEENRQNYQDFVLVPLQLLVRELSETMLSIDPLLETRPAVGKTISRIHRDTRFSHDKSPYRSNAWVTFKRSSSKMQTTPAWFFEITPSSYSYGMGYYMADKETMDHLRQKIKNKPSEFENAIAFYSAQQTYKLEGDTYKRTLLPSLPKALQPWYQKKDLYLICNKKADSRLFDSELVGDLKEDFTMLSGFYHYLLDEF
jgi:uncharacterized protein (TIGR02453 family)